VFNIYKGSLKKDYISRRHSNEHCVTIRGLCKRQNGTAKRQN